MRAKLLAAAALATAFGAGFWWLDTTPPPEPLPEVLPLPPFPPRVAQGERYERCLVLLTDDAPGALTLAETWLAEGGGDGATHCRGLALIADGRPELGVPLLERLAETSAAPDLARASILGQAARIRLMTGQADLAERDATLALTLAPSDADLLVTRATAEIALGQPPKAIDDLTKALALKPARPDALILRAAAWRRQNLLDRAKADIDRAIALDPDDPEALLERGILRLHLGDRDGARADWQQARAIDPNGTVADLAEQNLALLDAGPNQR